MRPKVKGWHFLYLGGLGDSKEDFPSHTCPRDLVDSKGTIRVAAVRLLRKTTGDISRNSESHIVGSSNHYPRGRTHRNIQFRLPRVVRAYLDCEIYLLKCNPRPKDLSRGH